MMLMKFVDLSQSDRSNWVIVTGQGSMSLTRVRRLSDPGKIAFPPINIKNEFRTLTCELELPHMGCFQALSVRNHLSDIHSCCKLLGNIRDLARLLHGSLTRYVKLWVAPGMPGTCVTHVPWCMSGSLTRVPGIQGACAAHNFTYLARGPS